MFLKSDVAVKIGSEAEARVYWYLEQARPLGVEIKFWQEPKCNDT